jgi:hypothetical protein
LLLQHTINRKGLVVELECTACELTPVAGCMKGESIDGMAPKLGVECGVNGSADQQPAADVKGVRPKESCAQADAVRRREG